MILESDFAKVVAAAVSVIMGVLVAGVFLYARRKIRKPVYGDDLRRIRGSSEELGDRTVCLYSTHDLLNTCIIRASRGRR